MKLKRKTNDRVTILNLGIESLSIGLAFATSMIQTHRIIKEIKKSRRY